MREAGAMKRNLGLVAWLVVAAACSDANEALDTYVEGPVDGGAQLVADLLDRISLRALRRSIASRGESLSWEVLKSFRDTGRQ